MKKVVLGLMFLFSSAIAMEDTREIESLKEDLDTYVTCLETLRKSITTNENRDFVLNCSSLSNVPPFAEDHRVLIEIRKYTPKICRYLTDIMVDPEPYLYSDEGLSAQDALKNAIESQVYGTDKKMADKRQTLMNAYSEVISKM